MITFQSNSLVFYDVDDTLVLYNDDKSWGKNNKEAVRIKDPYLQINEFDEPKYLYLKPNEATISLLKAHKASGKTIVVGSKGGWKWAKEVVTILGLETLVDMVMSKPDAYIDDNDATCWMGTFIAVGLGGKLVHDIHKRETLE